MRLTQYERARYINKENIAPLHVEPMPEVKTRGRGYVINNRMCGERFMVTRQIASNMYYLATFEDEATAKKMAKAYDNWLNSFNALREFQKEYDKLRQWPLEKKVNFLSNYL